MREKFEPTCRTASSGRTKFNRALTAERQVVVFAIIQIVTILEALGVIGVKVLGPPRVCWSLLLLD